MEEHYLQIVEASKLLWASFAAVLYAYGGMVEKRLRRYLASAWIVIGYALYGLLQAKFSWWYALSYPLFIAAYSIGYGAEHHKTWYKVGKRFLAGAAIATASLPIAFINGSWLLFAVHSIIATGLMVVLGVLNPTNARAEETVIGLSSCFLTFYFLS